MCRLVCTTAENDESESSESDDDMDENQIIAVADRIQAKLEWTDVTHFLKRFRLPNGIKGLNHRQACELLAEQLTHETDEEDSEEGSTSA